MRVPAVVSIYVHPTFSYMMLNASFTYAYTYMNVFIYMIIDVYVYMLNILIYIYRFFFHNLCMYIYIYTCLSCLHNHDRVKKLNEKVFGRTWLWLPCLPVQTVAEVFR